MRGHVNVKAEWRDEQEAIEYGEDLRKNGIHIICPRSFRETTKMKRRHSSTQSQPRHQLKINTWHHALIALHAGIYSGSQWSKGRLGIKAGVEDLAEKISCLGRDSKSAPPSTTPPPPGSNTIHTCFIRNYYDPTGDGIC